VALGVLHETVYVLDHNGVLKHKFVVRNWLVNTHLLVCGVPFLVSTKLILSNFNGLGHGYSLEGLIMYMYNIYCEACSMLIFTAILLQTACTYSLVATTFR